MLSICQSIIIYLMRSKKFRVAHNFSNLFQSIQVGILKGMIKLINRTIVYALRELTIMTGS